jgi:hypothetical protein
MVKGHVNMSEATSKERVSMSGMADENQRTRIHLNS